ncbi:MAG TPA: lysylphosphatidylglycerol synthase domain-containing protein [Mycobacteriales bacterium]|nr:lysylphosphatidylglycerol synthase domain-containing protein [Mycobacteriales bacterium]
MVLTAPAPSRTLPTRPAPARPVPSRPAGGSVAGRPGSGRPAPGRGAVAQVPYPRVVGGLAGPVGIGIAAGAVAGPAVAAVRRGRRHLVSLLGGGVLVAAVVMLTLQLRDAELGAAFAAVDLSMLAAGLGWYALSMVAAAYTVTGFSPLPLRFSTTLLAQLAVGGLRLVVPSAAGMPAVIVRYLTRSGAGVADAAATVAAGQAAQLVATAAVVAALGAGSGHGLSMPSGTLALVVLAVLAGLALAGSIAARVSATVRSGLRATWRGQDALAGHARQHPGRVAAGLAASAALTLLHVLAFAACVSAAGGHLPLVTLAAVYLGAATAGSLIPAPGGIGPVEAALVAGLTATGLPLPAATAAALLSRLVSVWLPAVPGLVAAGVLRRRALL